MSTLYETTIVKAEVTGLELSKWGTIKAGAVWAYARLSNDAVVCDVWPLVPEAYSYLGLNLQAYGFTDEDAYGNEEWLRGARAEDLAVALVGRCALRPAHILGDPPLLHYLLPGGRFISALHSLPPYIETDPVEVLDELLEEIRAGVLDLKKCRTYFDPEAEEDVAVEDAGGLARADGPLTSDEAAEGDFTHARQLVLLSIAESPHGLHWEEVWEDLAQRGTPVRRNTIPTRISELHHDFGWIEPTGDKRPTSSRGKKQALVYVALSHRAHGNDPHRLYLALKLTRRDKIARARLNQPLQRAASILEQERLRLTEGRSP